METQLTKDEKNGKYKEFNRLAILISEGHYVNGLKHGLWKEYYDHSGKLLIEEEYSHGVKHGAFSSYHPNGKLMSKGTFRNGMHHGYFYVYDETGATIRVLSFDNEQLVDDRIVTEGEAVER